MAWYGETKQGNAWHRCLFGGWDPGVSQPGGQVSKAVKEQLRTGLDGFVHSRLPVWLEQAGGLQSKTFPLLPLPTTIQKGERIE